MSIIELCTMFGGITHATAQGLQGIIESEVYPTGTFIFEAGEPALYFHILEEGRVRLRFSDGGQVAYTLSEPGDTFGWSSMVNQPQYALTAQSVSRVKVARVKGTTLLQLLQNDPASGMLFYRNLADSIGQRLFNSYRATVFVHGERSSQSYG